MATSRSALESHTANVSSATRFGPPSAPTNGTDTGYDIGYGTGYNPSVSISLGVGYGINNRAVHNPSVHNPSNSQQVDNYPLATALARAYGVIAIHDSNDRSDLHLIGCALPGIEECDNETMISSIGNQHYNRSPFQSYSHLLHITYLAILEQRYPYNDSVEDDD